MRVRGWSGRSGLAKVDLCTRGTVYLLVWVALLALTLIMLTRPVRLGAHPAVAVGVPLLAVANGVFSTLLARHAMDAYLGQGPVPRRLVGGTAFVAALATGTALWLAATAGMEKKMGPGVTQDRVRVLPADDEHLIRGALAALLALEDDQLVVAEAASGTEVPAMARSHRPTWPSWISRCPAATV